MLASCGGGGAKPAATGAPETPTAAIAAAPTPRATPTADAPGSPQPDGQRAYEHVRKLAVEIGPRVAGTPGEIAARDYIASTLESYGYDVALEEFAFDASAFLPARVDAGDLTVQGFALDGSASGVARGRLISAGIGRPEDFPAGGAAGAIVLVQRGELTFTDKVANATAAGAVGVIVYNNAPGGIAGKLATPAAIPVEGIDQASGEGLLRRIAAGPVDATLTVSPAKGTAYNVVARPKGAGACTTVSGGHYDSVPVTGGADDDAAGSASVLELARVAAANKLGGANCFVLFSAEEFGLFGSKAFVERLSPDELAQLRGMINLDVVGLKEDLQLIGDGGLVATARAEAQKLGLTATQSSLPDGAGSDHISFQKAGVPVVMLYRDDNLIHRPEDAIGRIDAESLRQTVAVAYATLTKIAAGGG